LASRGISSFAHGGVRNDAGVRISATAPSPAPFPLLTESLDERDDVHGHEPNDASEDERYCDRFENR
jgi:hypothetical protein